MLLTPGNMDSMTTRQSGHHLGKTAHTSMLGAQTIILSNQVTCRLHYQLAGGWCSEFGYLVLI